MIYEIKGQLATLNEHDEANRGEWGWVSGRALKKKQTELVAHQLADKKTGILLVKPITKPCFMTWHWFYSGRHDFDNICFAKKYVLDGMVMAGVLKSDGQKYVLGFGGDDFTKVEKGKEGVLVEVEEISEDS